VWGWILRSGPYVDKRVADVVAEDRANLLVGDSSNEMALVDTLRAPDPRIESFDELETLRDVLAGRPDREREVVYLRFYEDMTQQEIADRVGMSQMNVSRILNASFEQIGLLLQL